MYTDGRTRAYHRRNEHYTEACSVERDRFGGGAFIMVWGGVPQLLRIELDVIERCALQGRHPPLSCGTLPAGSFWIILT